MKPKTKKQPKKIINKILKIIWITLGILIFLWTSYWFVRVKIFHDHAFIINVMMFSFGVCAVLLYIALIFIFFIIKRLKK